MLRNTHAPELRAAKDWKMDGKALDTVISCIFQSPLCPTLSDIPLDIPETRSEVPHEQALLISLPSHMTVFDPMLIDS